MFMKKTVCIMMSLFLVFIGLMSGKGEKTMAEEKADTIKLLAIGNSFSEDSLYYLREVSLSSGADVAVYHLVIGGSSLEQHWKNASRNLSTYTFVKKHTQSFSQSNKTMEYGLEYDDYDYIVLQQVSGLSGISSSYEPYLSRLIEYIRKYNQTAELMFHQTWAYEKNSTHVDFSKYNHDQETMYEQITEAADIASNAHGLRLIPSGEAMHKARENSRFDIEKGGISLCRDGYHASENGRVLLALVWNGVLTGKRAVDNPYTNPNIPDEDMKILKEAADYALDLYRSRRIKDVELKGSGRIEVLQNEVPVSEDIFLEVDYCDGRKEQIPAANLSGIDTSLSGEREIRFYYWKKEFALTVAVIPREKVDLLIEHIKSVLRFPNIKDIQSLLVDYEALSPIERAGVTNYEDLLALKEEYLKPSASEESNSSCKSSVSLTTVPFGASLGVLALKKKRKKS